MVGLDIGSKTIKIVELTKEGQGFGLSGSGIVGYSIKSADGFNEQKEIAEIGAVVKKLHKEARISGKDVVISLPESQAFTRIVKFPPLTDQEIASAVKWEAEQYIPIPLTEAIVQHQVLERKEGGSSEAIVLLVAAPKNLVEKYIAVVETAGLNVVAAETELIALTRALAPADKTVMLLDFGSRSADIAIAKNGNLYFSRSIPTAGEAFTRAIATNLGVEYKQAEAYKKTYGLSGESLEGKIKLVIDPVFRIVTDEIKKAIHFYQTESAGDPPSLVILSGGTSSMPNIASGLTKLLGLEVIFGNPFAKISMDEASLKALAPYSAFYSIAVGLAERSV